MAQNYSSSSSSSEEEEDPPSASEDEQTSHSNSEPSDSDSEPNPNPKKPLIPPPKSNSKSSSEPEEEEEEESASDTDSDSPPQKSFPINPSIKPISSIPMERNPERERSNLDPKSAKKTGFKTGSTTPAPAGKRPASGPAGNEKELKKGKGGTVTEDDSKKQLFQRLWSEDDEIEILKGMIDYRNETGESLIADMGAFHEFIKKNLHVDVSRAQLVDKIRRLKKKYVNNASREKNGKDRSFSKSHEQKGYELSKLIWGGSNNSGIEGKKIKIQRNGNVGSTSGGTNAVLVQSNGVVEDKEVSMMDISRFVRYGGRDESPVLPEEIVKAGMELVDGSKRVELEERWKSLKKQELELYLKKMELIKEQALVVLEAVNSSGS